MPILQLGTRQPDSAFEAEVRARRAAIERTSVRAAIVLGALVACLTGYAVWYERANYSTYRAGPNATLVIDLPEGSSVRLAAASQLKHWGRMVGTSGSIRRDTKLEGAAAFTVRPAGSSLFSVTTEHARVSTRDARFSIESHDGFTRIIVEDGSVFVRPLEGDRESMPVVVDAGQSVRVLGARVVPDDAAVPKPNGT